jgi:hypothetical protein
VKGGLKMKKTIMTSILALGVGIILVSQASASVVSERLYNQKLRIRQGVISGELSRGEAQVLKKEQRRIRKNLKKAWADGKVTRPEWRRIQILQNRASNHIYRLKHNSNSRHRVHDKSHQFKYIY